MLRLHPEDEAKLMYWANGWLSGDAGARSIQGPIQDALERGTMGGGSLRLSEGISDHAMWAAGYDREIRRQIAATCTGEQRYLLAQAFLVRDVPPEVRDVFGPYPGAAVAIPEVWALFKESGGIHSNALWGWMAELVRLARATDGRRRNKRQAQQTVDALVEAIASALSAALLAFGARVEDVTLPPTVRVSEIARATELSDDTVRREVQRRQVRRFSRRDGWRILTSDLPQKWPEAARALGAA